MTINDSLRNDVIKTIARHYSFSAAGIFTIFQTTKSIDKVIVIAEHAKLHAVDLYTACDFVLKQEKNV